MSEVGQLKRRIRQLEKCLDDLAELLIQDYYELRDRGADNNDNTASRSNSRLLNRLNRTRRKKNDRSYGLESRQ